MTVEHTREFDTSFSTILIQIPYLSHLWLIFFTGNKGNQDVYIKQSYRKDNGKTSSRIYKKLGKYNDLLAQFSGDETAMMAWAKKEAEKGTLLYNQRREKVTVSFSPLARIPLGEGRLFNVGYLFLQQLCTKLRLDNIC